MAKDHIPVLLKEAIEGLKIQKGKKYIDATVGRGGHSEEILKRDGIVLGIDADSENITFLKEKWQKNEVRLVCGNFKNLKNIARKNGFNEVSGILFDLGISSWQMDKSKRGFSYLREENLDMRLNPNDQEITASEILNKTSFEELVEILEKYAEEERALKVARLITKSRPIKNTRELVQILEKISDSQRLKARVFQALRITVNQELENLRQGLSEAVDLLEKGGRIAVISFHSLEDRIVKLSLKNSRMKIITKKPVLPIKEEIKENSRAKSAKMRIAEKI